ncbi:MAG: metallophosphoesterase, partial [Abditibacteriota bacterium]|nr:metallophosphoesterase [Abditibacteriota bacterium]
MKKLLFLAALISLCAPGFCKEKSMAELNPDFENALTQAVKPKNEGSFGYKKETPCFVLFHFSDIHGDALEFRRYAEFLDKYDKYFDGAVCTGDFVTNTCNDDFSYWGK